MDSEIALLKKRIAALEARIQALEAKDMVFGPLPPDEKTAIEHGNDLARIIKETMEREAGSKDHGSP